MITRTNIILEVVKTKTSQRLLSEKIKKKGIQQFVFYNMQIKYKRKEKKETLHVLGIMPP